MDKSALISVMSLAVALAALFLGPYFAHRKTIAEMRQAWINTLRDCVADFLSLVARSEIAWRYRDPHGVDDFPEGEAKLMLPENKIELLLNPQREQHRELITLTHQMIDLIFKSKKELSEDEFIDRKAGLEIAISAVTQHIIRREWTRTTGFWR